MAVWPLRIDRDHRSCTLLGIGPSPFGDSDTKCRFVRDVVFGFANQYRLNQFLGIGGTTATRQVLGQLDTGVEIVWLGANRLAHRLFCKREVAFLQECTCETVVVDDRLGVITYQYPEIDDGVIGPVLDQREPGSNTQGIGIARVFFQHFFDEFDTLVAIAAIECGCGKTDPGFVAVRLPRFGGRYFLVPGRRFVELTFAAVVVAQNHAGFDGRVAGFGQCDQFGFCGSLTTFALEKRDQPVNGRFVAVLADGQTLAERRLGRIDVTLALVESGQLQMPGGIFGIEFDDSPIQGRGRRGIIGLFGENGASDAKISGLRQARNTIVQRFRSFVAAIGIDQRAGEQSDGMLVGRVGSQRSLRVLECQVGLAKLRACGAAYGQQRRFVLGRLEPFFDDDDRFVRQTGEYMNARQIRPRIYVPGIDIEGRAVVPGRLPDIVLLLGDQPRQVARIRVIGVDLQRVAKLDASLVEIALVEVGLAGFECFGLASFRAATRGDSESRSNNEQNADVTLP